MSKKDNALAQLEEEIRDLKVKYGLIEHLYKSITKFEDLPISRKTLKGLSDASFTTVTEIQQESIYPALVGKDIIGAAITGSGKTLAFLIPVLENLYINKWTRSDGLGVLIISPTRELAYQTFQMLRKIGKHHDFSAGLIIGGKNLKFEKGRMDQCNILVCTPGRLLQHMDENPLFNTCTMQILVLDEADRCLDMGFEETLNAILSNLPPQRQTLLFSATQNRSVDNLARLQLKNIEYTGHIWKNLKEKIVTVPTLLKQSYVVVELENKMKVLWSFFKSHTKQKIIVFVATCKQVKYIYELFCKLRPGISLLALYGTLNQQRRISIYDEFIRKKNVALIATDIASRGLDFPFVSWVVQLDCPEDVTQYIHRAGRSARNKTEGESLLILMPSEEDGMIEMLKKERVSVKKIHIDENRLFSPHAKIEALCAQNSELKASAQRAFIAYIKNASLMRNKSVFDVSAFNFEAYAKSLGLVVTPRVRFMDRSRKKNTSTVSPSRRHFSMNEVTSDSEDELFKVKRANHGDWDTSSAHKNCEDISNKLGRRITKTSVAKKAIKKKISLNKKVQFDSEGQKVIFSNFEDLSTGINVLKAQNFLIEQDKLDKERFKNIIKGQHRNAKKRHIYSKSGDNKDYGDVYNSDNASVPQAYSENNMKNTCRVFKNSLNSNTDIDFNHKPLNKKKKMGSMSLTDIETIATKLLFDS